MIRRLRRGVALAALALLAPGALHAQAPPAPPAARYTPLVHGWESFFTISWDAMQRRSRPWIGGYVSNTFGFTATRVQLLVEGLDESGRVVSQSVGWAGTPIPPGSRVYFELPAPGPAASYRVSVFAFDWLQTASIQAP